MQYKRQWRCSVSALAVIWGLAFSLPQAQAVPIGCGAVLGPGGTFVLDSDVGPCSGPGPALTLISATLDLAGHTVSCTDQTIFGIELEGKKSKVRNGTVRRCSSGVVLLDQGHHTVQEVTASRNSTGFTVGSPQNRLRQNTATGNDSAGFAVGSAQNHLIDNQASGSESGFLFIGAIHSLLKNNAALDNFVGFEMFKCQGNVLAGNTASGSASHGFKGDLDIHNHWIANTATGNNVAIGSAGGFSFEGDTNGVWDTNTAQGNKGYGYSFVDGEDDFLNDNRAASNGLSGFRIEESEALLVKNEASSNTGPGFTLAAGTSGAQLRANQALSNGGPGIKLEDGATDNRIIKSNAVGNGSFDLVDDNFACDANKWQANTFGLASKGCIH